jgi:hypothetical protein
MESKTSVVDQATRDQSKHVSDSARDESYLDRTCGLASKGYFYSVAVEIKEQIETKNMLTPRK